MALVQIRKPETKELLIEYHMEDRMKKNLDEKVIPSLMKKDKDAWFVIDGKEGSGKSSLALQIGKYVDPTLDLNRVVFNAEDFEQATKKAKKGQCVIFDEAFVGLSARASLSTTNKKLISIAMQIRQKNLFIILVLPTFFLLDKYMALFRTRALIHVFESKGRRGYYRVFNYNKKKYLYLMGKNTYTYQHKKVRTNFKGRFYGKFALGNESVEEEYRKRKLKALQISFDAPMSAGQIKYKEQRDILLWRLRRETKMTYQEMANYLEDYNVAIHLAQIRNICVKFGDKESDTLKKPIETYKNSEELPIKEANALEKPENEDNSMKKPKKTIKKKEKNEINGEIEPFDEDSDDFNSEIPDFDEIEEEMRLKGEL